jgi:hypothetical protein
VRRVETRLGNTASFAIEAARAGVDGPELVNVVDTLGDEVILGDEVTVGEIFGEKTGEKVMLKLPGG